jgi:hypothetical protein
MFRAKKKAWNLPLRVLGSQRQSSPGDYMRNLKDNLTGQVKDARVRLEKMAERAQKEISVDHLRRKFKKGGARQIELVLKSLREQDFLKTPVIQDLMARVRKVEATKKKVERKIKTTKQKSVRKAVTEKNRVVRKAKKKINKAIGLWDEAFCDKAHLEPVFKEIVRKVSDRADEIRKSLSGKKRRKKAKKSRARKTKSKTKPKKKTATSKKQKAKKTTAKKKTTKKRKAAKKKV